MPPVDLYHLLSYMLSHLIRSMDWMPSVAFYVPVKLNSLLVLIYCYRVIYDVLHGTSTQYGSNGRRLRVVERNQSTAGKDVSIHKSAKIAPRSKYVGCLTMPSP